MNCDKYEKYCLDQISENKFLAHKKECSECQQLYELDAEIEKRVRLLKNPVEQEGLWSRIKSDLQKNSQNSNFLWMGQNWQTHIWRKDRLSYSKNEN